MADRVVTVGDDLTLPAGVIVPAARIPDLPAVNDADIAAKVTSTATRAAVAGVIAAEVAASDSATRTALSATYAQAGTYGLAGGRALMALNSPRNLFYPLGTGTAQAGYRAQHTAVVGGSDVRLVYAPPNAGESDLSNALTIEAWIEPTSGAVPIQVTFGGKRQGTLEPGGTLTSDPLPMDFLAGAVFYSRTWALTPFGTATTLAAASSIGATSLSVTAAPPAAIDYPFDLVVDTGGNKEIVSIANVTGSGPYTYTLATGTTAAKAHASGVTAGQEIVGNLQLLSDRNEGSFSTRAACATGTASSLGTSTTPTTAAASIGDTQVTVTGAVTATPGTWQVTLDTAGNAETLTVANVLGTANPFTWVFTTPLTKAHASGVNLIGSGAAAGLAPAAVVADRLTGTPKPVVMVGDSIPSGQGNTARSAESYLFMALNDASRPAVFTTKGGETAQTFAALANSWRRRKMWNLAPAGSWAWFEYGTNDLYGGRTLVQMKAAATTIITALKARGLKVTMQTLVPRTTSTDGWTTAGNQTINASPEAVRVAYNAWVRAGADGLADKVADLAAVTDAGLFAGGSENGLWRVGANAAGALTIDGIHPSLVGHLAMKAAAATILATMA